MCERGARASGVLKEVLVAADDAVGVGEEVRGGEGELVRD